MEIVSVSLSSQGFVWEWLNGGKIPSASALSKWNAPVARQEVTHILKVREIATFNGHKEIPVHLKG